MPLAPIRMIQKKMSWLSKIAYKQCRNCYTSKLRLCVKVRVMENKF